MKQLNLLRLFTAVSNKDFMSGFRLVPVFNYVLMLFLGDCSVVAHRRSQFCLSDVFVVCVRGHDLCLQVF